MFPPGKDLIIDQNSTRIITQQDPILSPLLAKWPTGYKPFLDDTHFSNKTEDKHNYSTDNSRTKNKYSVNNMNVKRMNISMMNTKKIIKKLLKVMKV